MVAGDFPDMPNSSERIQRCIRELLPNESKLMPHLREYSPQNEFDIKLIRKSCILRVEDMKSSLIYSGNLNGFKTFTGEDVVRKIPPHIGGKILDL